MATVKHPRIPNVTVNVPDGDVSRWQASGWVADAVADDRPAGNASRGEWVAYALAQGADEDAVEDLTRDELRDLYTD